jgi:hypothetical protein
METQAKPDVTEKSKELLVSVLSYMNTDHFYRAVTVILTAIGFLYNLVVPIVFWQTGRDASNSLDAYPYAHVLMLCSALVYLVIGIFLERFWVLLRVMAKLDTHIRANGNGDSFYDLRKRRNTYDAMGAFSMAIVVCAVIALYSVQIVLLVFATTNLGWSTIDKVVLFSKLILGATWALMSFGFIVVGLVLFFLLRHFYLKCYVEVAADYA